MKILLLMEVVMNFFLFDRQWFFSVLSHLAPSLHFYPSHASKHSVSAFFTSHQGCMLVVVPCRFYSMRSSGGLVSFNYAKWNLRYHSCY